MEEELNDYPREYPFLRHLVIIPCKDAKKMAIRKMKRDRARNALVEAMRKGIWLEDGTSDTLPDAEYFNTYWWQACKEAVLMRDHYTCTMCGITKKDGAKLHVHHILPRHCGGSDNPLNLRTLCEDCHHRIHEELRERGM